VFEAPAMMTDGELRGADDAMRIACRVAVG
jgi:hypothetical protein